ncbi:MAG: hypothetical protein J6S21_01880, partial [Victivallales bacterium]|nr:hypothetical protein [Victivallales bacterium]
MEKNYDFICRMQEIHKPGRRNTALMPSGNETLLDSSWRISLESSDDAMLLRAARDLQDYLLVSMGVSVPVVIGAPDPEAKCIFLGKGDFSVKGAFTLEVTESRVVLTGDDSRGVLYGCIRLEDLMNFRSAPFLSRGTFRREPLARMRSVHSGCGIDQYPDWQLNAILHAGFTAVDIFLKDVDLTAAGYCNVGDVIRRAAAHGLDTVIYSYLKCYVHPDDPGAEAEFDRVFGTVAAAYPEASAIHLVGESLEFPSKDPATSGKRFNESVADGIPDVRPAPGWYPCCD